MKICFLSRKEEAEVITSLPGEYSQEVENMIIEIDKFLRKKRLLPEPMEIFCMEDDE